MDISQIMQTVTAIGRMNRFWQPKSSAGDLLSAEWKGS
jgi:hypothetical protein